jgi:hypothetical protein
VTQAPSGESNVVAKLSTMTSLTSNTPSFNLSYNNISLKKAIAVSPSISSTLSSEDQSIGPHSAQAKPPSPAPDLFEIISPRLINKLAITKR